MLDNIFNVLKQGWIGNVVGIFGIVIAVYFYRKSLIGPLPSFHFVGIPILGKKIEILPESIKIIISGKEVQRLSKVYVIFWNAGKKILKKSQIVEDDPPRMEFPISGKILEINITKRTNPTNKISVSLESNSNVAEIDFDYLNPGDGVVIEMLHISKNLYPTFKGTFKGVTSGIKNCGVLYGAIQGSNKTMGGAPLVLKNLSKFSKAIFIIGILCFILGFSPIELFRLIFKDIQSNIIPGEIRIPIIIMGGLLTIPAIIRLWSNRSWVPSELIIDDFFK